MLGAGIGAGFAGSWYHLSPNEAGHHAQVFVAKAGSYEVDLVRLITDGLRELGVRQQEIRQRSVLLKPNLVEAHVGLGHINTHPRLVRAAAEAFRRMGASEVFVGEGAGHQRDSMLLLEDSGLGEVLREDRISFVDLNTDDVFTSRNQGGKTTLKTLALPNALRKADWIVSMPKLKTHHWAGVTLSMKNLFGVIPGIVYGWPKNTLHWEGIGSSILDICATIRPHFAIVDGILGMEGDGPIMGSPRHAGVVALGRSLPAVDSTCARIMGIDPLKIEHLRRASGWLGPIRSSNITQVGEEIGLLRNDFHLIADIAAHQGIRL